MFKKVIATIIRILLGQFRGHIRIAKKAFVAGVLFGATVGGTLVWILAK